MNIINVTPYYYEQFDADYTLDIPAEGYGGWKKDTASAKFGKNHLGIIHSGSNKL